MNNWQTLDNLVRNPNRQILLRLKPSSFLGNVPTYVIRWSSDEDVHYDIKNGTSPYDAFAEIES